MKVAQLVVDKKWLEGSLGIEGTLAVRVDAKNKPQDALFLTKEHLSMGEEQKWAAKAVRLRVMYAGKELPIRIAFGHTEVDGYSVVPF